MHIYLNIGSQHYQFSKGLFHCEYSIYQRCHSALRWQKWDYGQYHHSGGKHNSMHHSHWSQKWAIRTLSCFQWSFLRKVHFKIFTCKTFSNFRQNHLDVVYNWSIVQITFSTSNKIGIHVTHWLVFVSSSCSCVCRSHTFHNKAFQDWLEKAVVHVFLWTPFRIQCMINIIFLWLKVFCNWVDWL